VVKTSVTFINLRDRQRTTLDKLARFVHVCANGRSPVAHIGYVTGKPCSSEPAALLDKEGLAKETA
jgi:hypothetical protein